MNLREAAQQALEALQIWQDSLTDPRAMPGWRFSVVGEKAIANLRAALAKDRAADTGKTYDTDDTPEQKMLRKKWFGGRLYGHLPFLAAVDETMKNLHDQLDELKGTWNMLDNHFPDVSKMVATSQESRQVEPVATIRPEVTVEPVATINEMETVEPVAWRWLYDGNPDGEKHFPMPGPTAEVIARAAACEFPRTVQYLYTAPPAPAWTQAHWTEYERGIVAVERERIAAWVEDMCVGLDAKTIANGIRNGGNDDIRAFEVRK